MAEQRAPLSIIVHSGEFDRVHYALVLASAAAAIDRPVILFFTMEACRALLPSGRLEDFSRRDAELAAKGLATLAELLGAAAELGIRIMACEMGLRAVGLRADELRADLAIEETGAVTFLRAAGPSGPTLFV